VSKKLERTESQTPTEPLLVPDSSALGSKPRPALVVIPRKLRARERAKNPGAPESQLRRPSKRWPACWNGRRAVT
jgi:hypothetical protein